MVNNGLDGFYGSLSAGYVNIANWKMAIEIVDLPMKHGYLPIDRVDYTWIERDIY